MQDKKQAGSELSESVRPRIGDRVRNGFATGTVDDLSMVSERVMVLWDDDTESVEEPETLEITRFGARWLKRELKAMGVKQ